MTIDSAEDADEEYAVPPCKNAETEPLLSVSNSSIEYHEDELYEGGVIRFGDHLKTTGYFDQVAVFCLLLGWWLIILTPLCALFRIIERRSALLWLLILILLQIGGFVDMSMDIYFIVRMILDGTFRFHFGTCVTIILSSLCSGILLLVIYILWPGGGGGGSGGHRGHYCGFFYCNGGGSGGGGGGSDGYAALCVVALIAVVCFKVVLMFFRLGALFWTLKVVCQGMFKQKDVLWIQGIGVYLLFDVISSGVPLGAMALINVISGADRSWFVWLKLSALAVDLMSGSYLIFYCVLDIESWCSSPKRTQVERGNFEYV